LTIEHTYMPLCSFQGTSLTKPLSRGLTGRALRIRVTPAKPAS